MQSKDRLLHTFDLTFEYRDQQNTLFCELQSIMLSEFKGLNMQKKLFSRSAILPENEFIQAAELVQNGQKLSKTVTLTHSEFLKLEDELLKFGYKKRQVANKKFMQHAQIGFRSLGGTLEAARSIYETVNQIGFRVDRYGICLDWSMGYPKSFRKCKPKGTGSILETVEDFIQLDNAAHVAPHFGDFFTGFPTAAESTLAALQAKSTSIGNLGQYFTF